MRWRENWVVTLLRRQQRIASMLRRHFTMLYESYVGHVMQRLTIFEHHPAVHGKELGEMGDNETQKMDEHIEIPREGDRDVQFYELPRFTSHTNSVARRFSGCSCSYEALEIARHLRHSFSIGFDSRQPASSVIMQPLPSTALHEFQPDSANGVPKEGTGVL